MSTKEINLRIVSFLVIGILLLLSLVICIYVVNGEKDLIPIEAEVTDVKKDSEGTGKNDITVSYKVNGTYYSYNFYHKDDVNQGDRINIYYHEDNVTSVRTSRTSKIIFIFPIVGMIFCVLGLVELFRNSRENDEEDDFKTKVISIIGDTEQLEIISEDNDIKEYVKDEAEENEVSVKSIKIKDSIIDEEDEEEIIEEVNNKEIDKIDVVGDTASELDLEVGTFEVSTNKMVSEKELKKRVEEKPKEKVKLMPKYYYVTGTTLVYDIMGKETEEISMLEFDKMVKTINSEGGLVKATITTKDKIFVLTNMNNVDLYQVCNLIHNKLITEKKDFVEDIEYKEW